ncbi:MAG: phosphoribosyltransferase [Verrucomicrobiota bacterium]
MNGAIYENRIDGAHALLKDLRKYGGEDAIVVGLPRGGVVVGAIIAEALDLPLDVIVARKIGAPSQPELAIGAVAPNGVRFIEPEAVRALGLKPEVVDEITESARQEAQRRMERYSGGRSMPDLKGKTVIIADDGLATGATARAAALAAQAEQPSKIVIAVPVGASDTVRALAEIADEVICPAQPQPFHAVGLWYRNFDQTTDQEVMDLLSKAPSIH